MSEKPQGLTRRVCKSYKVKIMVICFPQSGGAQKNILTFTPVSDAMLRHVTYIVGIARVDGAWASVARALELLCP